MTQATASQGAGNGLPRNLVICLDGTWNNTYQLKRNSKGEKVAKPSNVLKMFRAAQTRTSSNRDQILYYDIGVGSLTKYPGTSNWLLTKADNWFGGGWGAGFEGNIESALTFILNNYRPGDEVFIFGFSRGAATARGVTTFIDWLGGLPVKNDAYYLPALFYAFVDARGRGSGKEHLDAINEKRVADELEPLADLQKIKVTFLGVWDTVLALGSRFKANKSNTTAAKRSFYINDMPASCVSHARQALAIDEVRYDFRPEIWVGAASTQTLEQRWFSGVHSNVGGGYPDDGLANIAFRWIVAEAEKYGLEVDKDFIKFYRGFAMDKLYKSDTLFYKVFDRVRGGKGKRSLLGRDMGAQLEIDKSVIHRICADPLSTKKDGNLRFPDMQRKTYRPKNVIEYLASQPDLDLFLKRIGLDKSKEDLPEDVLKRINQKRSVPTAA